MARIKWIIGAIILLTLSASGISLFSRPDNEVLYDCSQIQPVCSGAICTSVYTMELGNSGWNNQSNVEVVLASAPLKLAVLPLKVANFGKIIREVDIDADDENTRIQIGRLKRSERVELSFVLQVPTEDEMPEWTEILRSVTAAEGKAKPGSAGWTTFGRLIWGVVDQIF